MLTIKTFQTIMTILHSAIDAIAVTYLKENLMEKLSMCRKRYHQRKNVKLSKPTQNTKELFFPGNIALGAKEKPAEPWVISATDASVLGTTATWSKWTHG